MVRVSVGATSQLSLMDMAGRGGLSLQLTLKSPGLLRKTGLISSLTTIFWVMVVSFWQASFTFHVLIKLKLLGQIPGMVSSLMTTFGFKSQLSETFKEIKFGRFSHETVRSAGELAITGASVSETFIS